MLCSDYGTVANQLAMRLIKLSQIFDYSNGAIEADKLILTGRATASSIFKFELLRLKLQTKCFIESSPFILRFAIWQEVC